MLDIKMSIYENHNSWTDTNKYRLNARVKQNTLMPDLFRKERQFNLGLVEVGLPLQKQHMSQSCNCQESSNVGLLSEGMAAEGTTHLPQFRSMHRDGRPAQYAQRYQGSLGNGIPSDEVLDMRQGQTLYRRLDCLGGRFPYVRGLIALEAHYQDAIPVRSDNESV